MHSWLRKGQKLWPDSYTTLLHCPSLYRAICCSKGLSGLQDASGPLPEPPAGSMLEIRPFPLKPSQYLSASS